MTDNLHKINQDAITENLADKLDLVRDIINCKKQLFGFGATNHKDAIESPAELFDRIYDLSIMELEILLAQLCAEASIRARKLIDWNNSEPKH